MTAPDNHPTNILMKHELKVGGKSHGSPISSMVRRKEFDELHVQQCEIAHPFPSPPWDNPVGDLMNLRLSRDEAKNKVPDQIKEEDYRGAMVIFADGCLSDAGGGSAVVSRFESCSFSCAPGSTTNNELELLAIGLAVAQFKENRIGAGGRTVYEELAIFSDSQIALKCMHEPLLPSAMKYLTRSIKIFLSKLKNVKVRLYWTPGHEGIEFNEKADKKAKEAAENDHQPQLTPTSLN